MCARVSAELRRFEGNIEDPLCYKIKKKKMFAADTGHKHRVAVGFQRADGLLIRQLIAARQGTERNPAVFGEGFCR